MACRVSAAEREGTVPMSSLVAGLRISMVRPEAASTHLPPMQQAWRKRLGSRRGSGAVGFSMRVVLLLDGSIGRCGAVVRRGLAGLLQVRTDWVRVARPRAGSDDLSRLVISTPQAPNHAAAATQAALA